MVRASLVEQSSLDRNSITGLNLRARGLTTKCLQNTFGGRQRNACEKELLKSKSKSLTSVLDGCASSISAVGDLERGVLGEAGRQQPCW